MRASVFRAALALAVEELHTRGDVHKERGDYRRMWRSRRAARRIARKLKQGGAL